MRHGNTRKNAEEKKQNQRAVRRWLRGQEVMNKFTQAERRAWLRRMTVEQARQVFEDLNQLGDRWKEHGGDLEALEQQNVQSKIEGRRFFLKMARRLKTIEGADG